MRSSLIPVALAIGAAAMPVSADLVSVNIYGTVAYNQVQVPPFAGVGPGSSVQVSFLLDSNSFVNSPNFPVRGYVIDQSSFTMKLGAATVGLQNPFPGGETPYFIIRDNDPQVDGFYISTNVDFPFGVPLAAQGAFGAFRNDFSVSYAGDTLSSLNLLDAAGTYEFAGLGSYFWAVTDGGFEPIGIDYSRMVIEVVPSPATLLPLASLVLVTRRRRA